MRNQYGLVVAAAAVLLLPAYGQQESPSAASASSSKTQAPAVSQELAALKAENQTLQTELTAMRAQVEELKLTPQVLLARVTQSLAADKVADAERDSASLDQRFVGSAQAKAATAALARYAEVAAAREAKAKALEARGFYALPAQRAPTFDGMTVRVESLQMGNRWQFDVHDDEGHYRDAERGKTFVLLRTTLHSTDKGPDLPDIGIYRINGQKMTRLAQMRYEFRRWSSYGTFIGLHHDFSNDFAHTPAIPFNAAASISADDAKQPFAVVVTGELCHERGKKISQPDVAYSLRYNCSAKSELSTEDFAKGRHQVLAFFNRPKEM